MLSLLIDIKCIRCKKRILYFLYPLDCSPFTVSGWEKPLYFNGEKCAVGKTQRGVRFRATGLHKRFALPKTC